MGLMSDNWIRSMSVLAEMICPFVLKQVGNGKISYGLSSYGYDIRVADEFYVTLEISNTAPLPAKIYANEGIAQIIFIQADERCEITYADRNGKYQRQQAIMLPTV